MRLYKVLDEEGRACHGGSAKWNLPTKGADGKWGPGEWMPEIQGELELCENGYHLCRQQDVLEWLGSTIYEAEYDGEIEEGKDKVVVRKARLLKRCENWTGERARLFACWCVRNTPLADGRTVWDLLTNERSKKAVEVSERYARGDATEEDLRAAQAAARDAWAARAAARDAWAAWAAWAAARDARDAAWAAWAAARDARAAAGAAERAAAWNAARDAAWNAAQAAQTKELLRLIEGGKDEK